MSKNIDSMSTLPQEVINLAVEKSEQDPNRYRPSYLLKVLHRSLPEGNILQYGDFQVRQDGRKRGVTMELDPSRQAMMMPASITHKQDEKSITINGIAFPGTVYGEEILAALDELYDSVHWSDLQPNEVFFVAAFFLSLSCTTHAFIDGNGRVSVGLAKFIIDRFSGFTLNLSELEKNNMLLVQSMNAASFNSLPDEENPSLAIIKQKNKDETINISDYDNQKMPIFIERFKNKLLLLLKDFSINRHVRNDSLRHNLTTLAHILHKASFTHKPQQNHSP